MAYDLATVTNSGNQLLASVVNDHSSLVIDKIEVSGTKLTSSTDLKSMTSISNVVKTLSANGYQKKDNSFIISTVLDNSSVKVDYKAWVFGIWAHKDDGGSSILMSVITSTNSPDTISKGSGTPIDYNYKFITTFYNTKSLKIKMSSDTYATNDTVLHNSGDETATGTKTFQEIKISNDKFPSLVQTDGQYVTLDGGNTEIVPADNSKVVHTTGDETIDGKKKFDTDPTDGAGNSYAKTVDVNQQLDKKVNVADMRKPASDVAGIEEVSTLQTQVDNSAVGTNLIVQSDLKKGYLFRDTGGVFVWSSVDFHSDNYIATNGETVFTFSSPDYAFKGSINDTLAMYDSNKKYLGYQDITSSTQTLSKPNAAYIRLSINFIVEGGTSNNLSDWLDNHRYKLEKGSKATDWCPNPEDKQDKIGYTPADDSKVIHKDPDTGNTSENVNFTGKAQKNNSDLIAVSDMRKPASDVAGIEEVSAKQDKIGYTPADDSKVLHTPLTQLNSTDMNTVLTAGFYSLNSGTNGMPGADAWTIYQVIPLDSLNGVQIAYQTNNAILGMRSWNSGPGHINFNNWVQFADDSKVAHLSGANNFDTVPTVDNNPLLLASSLPPDLARTGQANTFNLTQTFSQGAKMLQTGSYDDANSLVNEGLYYNTNSSIKNGAGSLTTGYIQVMSGYGEIVRQIMYSDTNGGVMYDRTSQNGGSSWSDWTQIATFDQIPGDTALLDQDANFTAKLQQNGQDVALANNTIYRNPNTGSVSSANTFTQPQTFSIAPTIKDASKDKGDNQAATMADLKSLENSAWRVMTGSSDIFALFTCLYKINTAKKRIELIVFGQENETDSGTSTIIDLSSIISGITTVDGCLSNQNPGYFPVSFSGTQLTCNNAYSQAGYGGMLSHTVMNKNGADNNPCYVYYTGLV